MRLFRTARFLPRTLAATLTALTGLVAATVWVAVPASADVNATDVILSPSQFQRITVTCPAGQVVAGGGAEVLDAGTGEHALLLRESAPLADGTGWMLALVNNDWIGSHHIRASASCIPRPAGYEVVYWRSYVAANAFSRASAPCSTGKVALGGGVRVADPGTGEFRTVLQENNPFGDFDVNGQWQALSSVRNNDAVGHWLFLAITCATRPARYTVLRTDVLLPPAVFFGFSRASVTCPSGTRVLGGGVQVVRMGTGDFHTELQESAPAPDGTSWVNAVRNRDFFGYRSLGMFAACA